MSASARRVMTKSPVALAHEALQVAQQSLATYSCAKSRHDFTQSQLFAMLVLRQFLKTDYRGVMQMLLDFAELRHTLKLKKVPHWTTLQKAEKRLLKKGALHDCFTSFLSAPRPAA